MKRSAFKDCPYCRELVRISAIKCRFCGELLTQPSEAPNAFSNEELRDNTASLTGVPKEEESFSQQSMVPPVIATASVDPRPFIHPNYFVRHWRGQLSLGVSYWLNGFMATLIFMFGGRVVSRFTGLISLRATAVILVLTYASGLAASVWLIVGAWRSASSHVQRGGQRFWANLAKVALIVGSLNLVRLAGFTFIPQMVEFTSILAGDTTIPAYQIRVLPGGTEIEFSGGLRAGCAKSLARILEATPQAKVIHLNSPGGRIHEAIEMAQLVRQRELITYTQEQCLSAASFVFVSGKERVVGNKAKLGFHRASLPGMTDDQRRALDQVVLKIFREVGVSKDFANRVVATPSNEMWLPSIEEMQAAGVITSQSFGDRFAVSGLLLRHSSPSEIDREWVSNPVFKKLKSLEPALYKQMVGEFSQAIQEGKTEADALAKVRGLFEPVVAKYLPLTSDDGVLAMRDSWIDLLEELKNKNSAACIAFMSPRAAGTNHNYASSLPDWVNTNALVTMDKVLSGVGSSPPAIDLRQATEDLRAISLKLQPLFGADLELLADEDKWMLHSYQVCQMTYALYRETQKLPRERQANLLRYMVSDSKAPAQVADDQKRTEEPKKIIAEKQKGGASGPSKIDFVPDE